VHRCPSLAPAEIQSEFQGLGVVAWWAAFDFLGDGFRVPCERSFQSWLISLANFSQ
jgi:hypothetical protein